MKFEQASRDGWIKIHLFWIYWCFQYTNALWFCFRWKNIDFKIIPLGCEKKIRNTIIVISILIIIVISIYKLCFWNHFFLCACECVVYDRVSVEWYYRIKKRLFTYGKPWMASGMCIKTFFNRFKSRNEQKCQLYWTFSVHPVRHRFAIIIVIRSQTK